MKHIYEYSEVLDWEKLIRWQCDILSYRVGLLSPWSWCSKPPTVSGREEKKSYSTVKTLRALHIRKLLHLISCTCRHCSSELSLTDMALDLSKQLVRQQVLMFWESTYPSLHDTVWINLVPKWYFSYIMFADVADSRVIITPVLDRPSSLK